MEQSVSHNMSVEVESFYLSTEVEKDSEQYRFGYHVKLSNLGKDTVQLISRSWKITDSNGKVMHVEGDGVVGKQPMLEPGESFEYFSGSVLESPVGTMEGFYHMIDQTGKEFDIPIPMFELAVPSAVN